MKINALNQNYYTAKQKQQSFGMKVYAVNDEAAELFKKWFTTERLTEVMPKVEAMKTKNGREIVVKAYGDLKKQLVNFVALSEGAMVKRVYLSEETSNNTFNKKGPTAMDSFLPTMKGIQERLISQIEYREEFNIEERNYYKKPSKDKNIKKIFKLQYENQ